MRFLIAAIVLSVSLSGCALFEQRTATPVTVKVIVPVPCAEDHPDTPAWTMDTAEPTMPLDKVVKLMRAELIQRAMYEKEYRLALEACRQAKVRP